MGVAIYQSLSPVFLVSCSCSCLWPSSDRGPGLGRWSRKRRANTKGGREEGASRKIDFEPEREEAGWKRREWIGEWVCPTEYIVKPRGQAVRLPTVDIQRDTQNRGIIHSGFFIRDVGFFFTGYIP